ncbi:MAG: hypothetical protein KatS3mg031_3126 [Chitinophagales bacterium]|nr:MAG: hypothetical protein KatS3mg031_3126 [Chitinophagales bacterium]
MEANRIFDEIHVISSKSLFATKLDHPLSPDVNSLHRIYAFDYRWILQLSAKRFHLGEDMKENTLTLYMQKLIHSLPLNIFIGEGGFIYTLCALITSVRLIITHNINYIYSSFSPASDHAIAWLLKIIFRKKVFWIADFRDLPVDPLFNNYLFPALQHKLWKRMLSNADLVTTVSYGLKRFLQNYNQNVIIIRNAISRYMPVSNGRFVKMDESKFTIAYTGSMHGRHSDPSLLLQTLQYLIHNRLIDSTKVELIYAGKDGNVWNKLMKQFNLLDIFTNKGILPLDDAIYIQRHANINLMLTFAKENYKGVITGKFPEYLYAGKPIMAIINGNKDTELESIFNKCNPGIILYNEESYTTKCADFILTLYNDWIEGKWEKHLKTKLIKEFLWEENIRKLNRRLG